MVKRTEYIKKLFEWKDEKVIKVITGIRRCGKSTLLKMYQTELLNNNIYKKQIITVNFEDVEFEELKDYKKLYNYICDKITDDKTYYVFLDEIQLVENFQKCVDSLFLKDNVDIYITGSNAYLLSGELATLLSGRYVEINLLPLSFKEFTEINPGIDKESIFADYMRYGSLPYIATLNKKEEKSELYIEGIYNTIIIKDIEARQERKELNSDKRKITDITLLKNISKFLASSIGNPISYKSIADFITSSGRKVSQTTVSDYVNALLEPYVFYNVERYDINGKQLLKQNSKMYITDLGIRNYIVPKKNYDLGFSLENIVYFELLRRGYSVYIGKVKELEIDFIARKGEETEYYQITASMTEESTFNREMAPFKMLKDNYPKYILTLDKFTAGNYDGIKVINILDWLLK